MSTLTEERPDTQTSHDGGDNTDEPIFAHYALKMLITDAYVFGTEIIALCGETFIPSRDPESLPVCPKCQSLIDEMYGDDDAPQ
jgi:hypothetical protein